MTPMLEQCARAICKARGQDPDRCTMGSGGVTTNADGSVYAETHCYRRLWQDHIGDARSVLLTLLNPTEEMVSAGGDAFLYDMRGRKLLKYLFAADTDGIGAYGYLDVPVDPDTQIDCATTNSHAAFTAMITQALGEGK